MWTGDAGLFGDGRGAQFEANLRIAQQVRAQWCGGCAGPVAPVAGRDGINGQFFVFVAEKKGERDDGPGNAG